MRTSPSSSNYVKVPQTTEVEAVEIDIDSIKPLPWGPSRKNANMILPENGV
jgi:hypothetical protein